MSFENRCNFSLIRQYDNLYKRLKDLWGFFAFNNMSSSMLDSLNGQEVEISNKINLVYSILLDRIGSEALFEKFYNAQQKYLKSLTEKQYLDLEKAEQLYLTSNGKDNSLQTFLDDTGYPSLNVIVANETINEICK